MCHRSTMQMRWFKGWILLLTGCFFVFSMDAVSQGIADDEGVHLSGESYVYHNEYAGSQFLYEGWQRGNVRLFNGQQAEYQLLRYNAYLEELIWMEPATMRMVKLDRKLVDAFSLLHPFLDEEIHFVKAADVAAFGRTVPSHVFLEKVYQGAFMLYARRQIVPTGRMESKFVRGRSEQRILIAPRPSYYILFPDGSLQGVSPNRRSFASAIAVYVPGFDIADLRRSRIGIRNEADLVRAIEWVERSYNQEM